MNLLTKQETATKLKASKRTVEHWVAQGLMPQPMYIGRRALWIEETINAWLRQKAGLRPLQVEEPTKSKRGRPRNTQLGKEEQL
jgi:excisionase family DNA binding protein